LLCATLFFACPSQKKEPNLEPIPQTPTEIPKTESSDEIKTKCLLRAYPDFLQTAENNLVIWKDSTQMMFDDGVEHSDYETMLNHADLKDQMAQCYPKADDYLKKLVPNYDPGRARNEAFFFKMYGNSAAEVEQKLVSIVWMPKNINKTIRVTSVGGIDKKFKQISDELDNLPPEFMPFLQNPAGTFNWRVIAGTTRQSTHSFGTTIDINVRLSHYWRNFSPDANGIYQYQNQIPLEIVRIFEKHGFIWGGKWYHYDTMHFEYRPELLDAECVCQD
jgi:peptidoglycan LD-endopeptidase CwlK